MKAWQRDKITAARKADKDIQPLWSDTPQQYSFELIAVHTEVDQPASGANPLPSARWVPRACSALGAALGAAASA